MIIFKRFLYALKLSVSCVVQLGKPTIPSRYAHTPFANTEHSEGPMDLVSSSSRIRKCKNKNARVQFGTDALLAPNICVNGETFS